MLNRQKTLLYLLRIADRPVLKTELTKWSFLLRHDFASQGGSAFYDFVPYRFGPFSFCLYQEAGKLENQGFIATVGTGKSQAWQLTDHADFKAPDRTTAGDAQAIVQKFGKQRLSSLIDYVYDRYPKYTYNSEIKKLAKQPTADPAVYTAGYEGLSADAFLDMLVQNGIQRLVDVRNNPIARRYGFHKSTLARLTGNLDIEHIHFPELGIVSEKRQDLGGPETRQELFQEYERRTLTEQKDAVAAVAQLAMEKPSVLVCMEAEPCCCHRSHLAKKVAAATNLPVVHLRPN
ncbi:MAG: DUF488 family protein [Pirellulaceae bacterium]|nr:DUF488 domain-containing protein [Planctomycetales bacterium]